MFLRIRLHTYFFICLFLRENFSSFFYRYSSELTIESSSHMVIIIVNITTIDKHRITRPELFCIFISFAASFGCIHNADSPHFCSIRGATLSNTSSHSIHLTGKY